MQEISATTAMTSLAEHNYPMYTGMDDLHLSSPMSTVFPSELEKQNKILRGNIIQLESDVKCILDLSIESDQRLLHFTKDIFTAKYANEPALSHNCESDQSNQTSYSSQYKQCLALKQESAEIITAIRCLEEGNKGLRVPGEGKKLSTELNDRKNVINQKEEKIKELHNENEYL